MRKVLDKQVHSVWRTSLSCASRIPITFPFPPTSQTFPQMPLFGRKQNPPPPPHPYQGRPIGMIPPGTRCAVSTGVPSASLVTGLTLFQQFIGCPHPALRPSMRNPGALICAQHVMLEWGPPGPGPPVCPFQMYRSSRGC
jgi:hypothetical protein